MKALIVDGEGRLSVEEISMPRGVQRNGSEADSQDI